MTDPGKAGDKGKDRDELELEVEEIGDLDVASSEADEARGGGGSRNVAGKPGQVAQQVC
jgi:hypothetical protein